MPDAEILLFARKIITMSGPAGGPGEGPGAGPDPDALAVLDGRVLWAGPKEDARRWRGSGTREYDFGEGTIVPGLIDAHLHTVSFGLSLAQLDLRPAAAGSISELKARIAGRAAATPPGWWILGRGYDQNRLAEGRHPTRQDLDAAAPGHPVFITHTSGHMSVANSLALRLARVSRDTSPPSGGTIVRDETGEPAGLLLETAQGLLRGALPQPDKGQVKEAIRLAHRQYAAEGLTFVQEAGCPAAHPEEIGVWQDLLAGGELTCRTCLMIHGGSRLAFSLGDPPALSLGLRGGFGGPESMLFIGPMKLMADGSLIGRTAVLREPFAGQGPVAAGEETGLWVTGPEDLRRLCAAGHACGWQLATHAIGDRAIEVTLDAYEHAMRSAPRPDPRHRIEHCGVLAPDLIDRLARTGAIAVTQPRFISELGDGFVRNLGPERARLAYPLRTLLQAGVRVAGGSDRPVVDGAPLLGLHDAVNETTAQGRPYAPEEALSWREALALFTVNAAHAAFAERFTGSLRPLKAADLTVLGGDPEQDPRSIASLPVWATMVGGRWSYLS